MDPPPNWESFETETTLTYLHRYYAHAQNTKIKTLYETQKTSFKPSNVTVWKALWETTWGKGVDTFQKRGEVQRDLERPDDSLLSETVPVHCDIAVIPVRLENVWKLACNNLLIRQDYQEAQRAVLWACGQKGPAPFDNIIISGSPGIGKSAFLLLLLLRRLAVGVPTGLQIHPEYSLLFWEGGVLEFCASKPDYGTSYSIKLKGSDDPLSRIWVLVDLNVNLTLPSATFIDRGPFFVVVAVSPRPERLQWTKKTISITFYMKPWSFSEVLQARTLVIPNNPSSEHDLWAFYSNFGPSPRHLFASASDPAIYIALVQQEVEKLSPELEHRLLEDPNLAWDASDLLVLTEPWPTCRFAAKKRIVTDHVSELLLQKRRRQHSHGPVIRARQSRIPCWDPLLQIIYLIIDILMALFRVVLHAWKSF